MTTCVCLTALKITPDIITLLAYSKDQSIIYRSAHDVVKQKLNDVTTIEDQKFMGLYVGDKSMIVQTGEYSEVNICLVRQDEDTGGEIVRITLQQKETKTSSKRQQISSQYI
eukprot:TRINITY_DN3122_c0_g2_i2.p2 TRINITY_DN3122_c0_g2~~TRINITY_DN3122_c0_g2_i2.p2  ORF type:complete len:112 (-),score=22.86 TRINITY_DN3122_c0_g2_i2:520-855(-)